MAKPKLNRTFIAGAFGDLVVGDRAGGLAAG